MDAGHAVFRSFGGETARCQLQAFPVDVLERGDFIVGESGFAGDAFGVVKEAPAEFVIRIKPGEEGFKGGRGHGL